MDRKALHTLSYGLYIVTSKKGANINGQIANTVFQATAEPAQVAACINRENLTHQYIEDSGLFSASVLSRNIPMGIIGLFGFHSGRDIDKFAEIKYKRGVEEVPIVLDYSVSYFTVKVAHKFNVGTHTLFVGEVVDAEIFSEEETMTYEFYHRVKHGISPKTAPTYYHEMDKEKEEEKVKKYTCQVCGYIYDPEKGDPDNGVPPGTDFNDLPDDWVCPVCGADKDQFAEEQ